MTDSASTAVIRQWARAHGLDVGDRGRLSPDVLAAYANQRPLSSGPIGDDPIGATQPTRRPSGRSLRVPVRPVRGATGIGRRVTARSS